jgi:hypothetical protein
MSNSKEILNALVTEDLYTAKKLINEELVKRMGTVLEEKLVEFGPTIFNEQSKPDFLDLDKDGNKNEPMKNAAKEAKKVRKESVDSKSETIAEEFEAELRSLVEEIEEETGEELSEEEIMELAQELLDVISEESEEEDDDEEGEDNEKEEAPKTKRMNSGSESY